MPGGLPVVPPVTACNTLPRMFMVRRSLESASRNQPGLQPIHHRSVNVGLSEDGPNDVLETALILLPIPTIPNGASLLFQERARNPRALVGSDLDPLPAVPPRPRFEKKAAFAERGR